MYVGMCVMILSQTELTEVKKKYTNTNVCEPVIYSGFQQMLALAPALNLGVKVL